MHAFEFDRATEFVSVTESAVVLILTFIFSLSLLTMVMKRALINLCHWTVSPSFAQLVA